MDTLPALSKQEKRNEELIEKAHEHAKAFAALYEANVEAQEEAQEEKPWYNEGDDDRGDPEGFFQIMQDFPDCEWPLDGSASDISETDTSDNEDVEEKMLVEPVERWTDEDEKNLADLKEMNGGAILVDADRLEAMIEKKARCDHHE